MKPDIKVLDAVPDAAHNNPAEAIPGADAVPSADTRQIGVSRPPLPVEDLPSPEEVFGSKHIGWEEMILFVLGPSVIALGISIGSGEWMLGPLNAVQYGIKGLGLVIMLSIVLQVFYNVELARFTIATGEAPVLAFGRTPPGWWLWVPLALISFYISFILGSWTVNAGASMFALVVGRAYQGAAEAEFVRILGIGLLLSCFFFLTIGRKIERTMEAIQGIFLPYVLVGLALVTLAVVPGEFWQQALGDLFTLASPPAGSDPSLLGGLAGFAALASGLNFMFIMYYRDKGYGMGYKVGFLSGLVGSGGAGRRRRNEAQSGTDARSESSMIEQSSIIEQQGSILPSGKIFPEDAKNAALWKRWFRFLLIDQWGIYFPGAVLGMILPIILVTYLASLPNVTRPDQSTIIIFAAQQLGQKYGQLLAGWALLTGFVILYSTQMVILDLLARNLTDAAYGVSERLRKWVQYDPRRFYYPALLALIAIIGILIHLATPGFLLLLSANLANFAALIFPPIMIYLNRQLPRPARIPWWGMLMLAANTLFFGFFFINYLAMQITGNPLVRF